MESFIEHLVTSYERGALTRRALIQSLSAVAAAGVGATTASAASLRAGSINPPPCWSPTWRGPWSSTTVYSG